MSVNKKVTVRLRRSDVSHPAEELGPPSTTCQPRTYRAPRKHTLVPVLATTVERSPTVVRGLLLVGSGLSRTGRACGCPRVAVLRTIGLEVLSRFVRFRDPL